MQIPCLVWAACLPGTSHCHTKVSSAALSIVPHSHHAAESFIKAPFALPGHSWAVAGLSMGPSPGTLLQQVHRVSASP